MASITRSENQVTWSASNSVSVAAGGTQTSDVITLDAGCIAARMHLKVDNSNATPASDDQIDFYWMETGGDPDGTGSDEYGTAGHVHFLARLDTNTEDPAGVTVDLPIPQDHGKLYATGADSGTTNAITVSATITEQIVDLAA